MPKLSVEKVKENYCCEQNSCKVKDTCWLYIRPADPEDQKYVTTKPTTKGCRYYDPLQKPSKYHSLRTQTQTKKKEKK